MEKEAKIYIAGHAGLIGSAILRKLKTEGYTNCLVKTHKELDLTRQKETEDFFKKERPECVILSAAKVGGIGANSTYPAEFIYDNIAVATNIIHAAYAFGVKKLLFFGSTCSYPRICPQPMKEEYLLSGYPEPTNEPYAVAKIAGIKMCEAYNRQYGTDFNSLILTNTYGINDHFDLNNSHVIPALIRKFHEAKTSESPTVTIWGTGSCRREFIFADDVAEAIFFFMEANINSAIVNVGAGQDISIKDLAELVKKVIGYKGDIIFDASKPDGAPKRLLDVSRLSSLGFKAKTSLEEGLKQTYQWYIKSFEGARI